MNVEIINTGSELMLGFVLNTHQQWLCRQLADLGHPVSRQVAVPDTGAAIQTAVKEALARTELIIVTGGLGPTSDDLTRDLIAKLFEKKLHYDATVLQNIETFFAKRGRPMPPNTAVQALVPEGALVLANAHGTAPGLVLEFVPPTSNANAPGLLVMLPGPPRELRPMFANQVVPLLRKKFPLTAGFVCHTFKTTGLGESLIQDEIAQPLKQLTDAGLEIGYCARVGEVDVRLVASGSRAEQIVTDAGTIVRSRIGRHIFSEGGETLETVVVRLLTERRQTLALAESCTGGHIANRITNVPGASAVLWAGLVTYSNESKQNLLGVRAETLAAHGAVSEPTAREMAEGARRISGADYALSVTGIAGPAGGTEAKPVGTVFIALASVDGAKVLQSVNGYDRETFKFVTSQQALEMLRRTILLSAATTKD
ncbi:MAG: competence/damage-inducible protein A [Verrucomicrobia bacterium]|nr:competence/damage-inducible protein A [Verrucomicrobiota bacterium]